MNFLSNSLFIGIICFSSFGFAQDLNDEREMDQQITRQCQSFEGHVCFDILLKFRKQVENESYDVTLKLCLGYLKLNGYEVPEHANSVSISQSVAAWSKISKEGMLVPLSSIAGLKSTYLSATDAGEFRSWFGSLYSYYLVQSNGFFEGAVHCLNTVDGKQINRFASTVLTVDYESNLAAEVAATYLLPTEKLISKSLVPVKFASAWLKANLMPTLTISAARARLLASAGVFVIGDSLSSALQTTEKNQKALDHILNSDRGDDLIMPLLLEKKLYRAFAVLNLDYEANKDRRIENYTKFYDFMNLNISNADFRLFENLLGKLNAQYPLTEEQKVVLAMLKPVVMAYNRYNLGLEKLRVVD